jgi:hypothetical protein
MKLCSTVRLQRVGSAFRIRPHTEIKIDRRFGEHYLHLQITYPEHRKRNVYRNAGGNNPKSKSIAMNDSLERLRIRMKIFRWFSCRFVSLCSLFNRRNGRKCTHIALHYLESRTAWRKTSNGRGCRYSLQILLETLFVTIISKNAKTQARFYVRFSLKREPG